MSQGTRDLPWGGTVQFAAIPQSPGDFARNFDGKTVWESLNSEIATINRSGLATAVGPGIATLSGTTEGLTDVALLTVLPKDVVAVSILVHQNGQIVASGQTQQFAALAQFSDGTTQDISRAAQWSSKNPSVASISADGMAAAGAPGKTEITARWHDLQGSSLLTIASGAGPTGRIVTDSTTAKICFPAAER